MNSHLNFKLFCLNFCLYIIKFRSQYLFSFLNRYLAIMSAMNTNMIEITCNDRLGKKVRVKCRPDDTIGASFHFVTLYIYIYIYIYSHSLTLTHTLLLGAGDVKKLVAAQVGTRPDKIVLKKWYNVFKDHITLADYEIKVCAHSSPAHSLTLITDQLVATLPRSITFDS